MANNGFDIKDRRKVMREKIAAMKGLWTEETFAYDGEFVHFTESWSWPKPTQKPHVPILLGAAPSEATLRDVVAWADGWIPIVEFAGNRLGEHLERLRIMSKEAGRDPETIEITLVNSEGAMGGKKSREEYIKRLPSADTIKGYEELGISRATLGIPMMDMDWIEWALDRVAELQGKVNGS
jgi:Luciferase-like monooxygenase